MAIYWHPYLTQLLRQDYEDRLIIEEEVPLGEMPLKLDILIRPRILVQELPFPFCHLGGQTIVEYKSPEDTAEHADLVQLEIYALMYQRRRRLWQRQEITLWLLASGFSTQMSLPDGAHLENEHQIGKGVWGGILDGFPTFLLNLNEIPLDDATLPLLIVSKGDRELELVEYLISHHQRLMKYIPYLIWLHWEKLEEVLEMRELTLEEIGVDMERVIRLIGKEKVIQHLSPDEILRHFSTDEILQHFSTDEILQHFSTDEILQRLDEEDEEQAMVSLVRRLGKDKARQLLEQISEES